MTDEKDVFIRGMQNNLVMLSREYVALLHEMFSKNCITFEEYIERIDSLVDSLTGNYDENTRN